MILGAFRELRKAGKPFTPEKYKQDSNQFWACYPYDSIRKTVPMQRYVIKSSSDFPRQVILSCQIRVSQERYRVRSADCDMYNVLFQAA